MTAQEKLNRINELLDTGATIYISTCLKSTKITSKNRAAWEKTGRPLLKVVKDSLYMGRGKTYDCIDYCDISAYK